MVVMAVEEAVEVSVAVAVDLAVAAEDLVAVAAVLVDQQELDAVAPVEAHMQVAKVDLGRIKAPVRTAAAKVVRAEIKEVMATKGITALEMVAAATVAVGMVVAVTATAVSVGAVV